MDFRRRPKATTAPVASGNSTAQVHGAPLVDESPQGKPASDRRLFATYLALKERLDRYFVNKTPMFTCGSRPFTINDVVAVAIQSGTNMYLIGSRGSGKTLLAETVRRSVFNDRGLYLRGDVNLNLKDLFMRLNLHGKTDEEIYGVAESLRYNFALIDELNRVPGVLQNQFLNLVDGYIEIRGQKYYLGSGEYMLAVATGNPPTNGEHPGCFDEDIALLDRIPLIINVDEVEHADGDVFRIMMTDAEKHRIALGDLTEDVIASYRYLADERRGDPETMAAVTLLAEFVYPQFRYVTVDGKRLDKAQDDGWRDALLGQHSGGNTISYASDVSIRTLKSAARLAFAMFKVAHTEAALLNSKGVKTQPLEYVDFLDSFLDALRLGLTYDRRFIPADLPKRLDKTHAEMLDAVFSDLASSIDAELFQDMGIVLVQFYRALRNGDSGLVQNAMSSVSDLIQEHPIAKSAYNVMYAEMRHREEQERNRLLKEALAEEEGGNAIRTSRTVVV